MAQAIGADLTLEQNKRLKGVSRMESLDQILLWNGIGLTDAHKEILAGKKNAWYLEMIRDLSSAEALPGAIDFIHSVRSEGYRTALGSASKNAATVLQALGIADLFDVMIDGTKTTRSKPDPQVFELGAEGLELPPRQIIVFEDAAKGVEAALKGGFWTIGIGEAEELEKAHHVIPGLEGYTMDHLTEELSIRGTD